MHPESGPRSLVVVTGPTASGKSALAIALARSLGGEIVNADSQQVYRGLDVGTAKPSAVERAAIRHHLFDVALPGEGMDAARWQHLADHAIADIVHRGAVPIVVGGTGLYLRALLHGIAPAPGRDPALRRALEAEAEREGRPALHRRLAQVDPRAAAKIGPNDLVRIVRALEIAASGQTQTEVFEAHAFAETRYRARLLALAPSRAELHERIEARLPQLFEGLLIETRRLIEARALGWGQGIHCEGAPSDAQQSAPPRRLPIGYTEAAAVLAGELDPPEALRRVAVAHRRYARRQEIWLRRESDVEWLPLPVDVESLVADLRRWLTR